MIGNYLLHCFNPGVVRLRVQQRAFKIEPTGGIVFAAHSAGIKEVIGFFHGALYSNHLDKNTLYTA